MEKDEFGIPIIDCSTPRKLLYQLDETRRRWKGGIWVFRGQNDITKHLHPSAMRKHSLISKLADKYVRNYIDREVVTDECAKRYCDDLNDEEFRETVWHALHIVIEKKIVGAFTELSDQSRIDVPTDQLGVVGGTPWPTKRLVDHFLNKSHSIDFRHDPGSIIYALAQHHGIPTRLLDWTFRPLVAAFFAAHESQSTRCKSDYEEPEFMVVWAVRWKEVGKVRLFRVMHQRSLIGNLQAQEGVFLFDIDADGGRQITGCWQCFEKALSRLVKDNAVYKFSLPFSKRQELLDLLALKGYRRPYLMPSYDVVAEEFTSQRLDPIEFMESY